MTSTAPTSLRRTVLGLVLACSLVPAIPSSAVQPAHTLSVDVAPNVAGTPGAPAPVTLTLHTATVPKLSDPPFSSTHVTFDLDPSIAIAMPGALTCSAYVLQSDASQCVPVGDGSMRMLALGLTEDMTISVFRGTAPQDVLLLVRGQSPLLIYSVLQLTGTTGPAGGTRLHLDVPANLQQPAPGAYAALTDVVVSLKSTVGLAGCPPSMALSFATRSDFTDGSSAQATAVTPCAAAPPPPPILEELPAPAPPPPAPVVEDPPARPVFATQVARHRGRVLGKLLALRSLRGMTVGKVSLRCDVGCPRHELGSRQLLGTEKPTLIRLHPAVSVTKRTRIRVVMVDASKRSHTQRFRFVRRAGGLVAKRI
jgi:hypothetical protein